MESAKWFNPFFGADDSNRKALAAAMSRVNAMDAIDGRAEIDAGLSMALRTVMTALSASRTCPSVKDRDECFFDAVAMLQQIELRQRNEEAGRRYV